MVRFLYNLLLMSISGSIMYLMAAAVCRLTRRRFSAWYYLLSVTAVILLIVPIQAVFTLPKLVRIEVSGEIGDAISTAAVVSDKISVTPVCAVFAIWLLISAVLTVAAAVKYAKTARSLKAVSRKTNDAEILSAYDEVRGALGIKKNIEVRICGGISSPLLFGALRPAIIIPNMKFSHTELKMLFAHELTHYRHKDLLIKLAAAFAQCVHWFNPLVYFLGRSVNEYCELCCDESVIKRLKRGDRKEYGRLLISVIEHTAKRPYAYTTAMASCRHIKRRLIRIAEFKKTSGTFKAIGVMTAVSMTVCSVTAFGIDKAKKIMPEPIAEFAEEAVTKPATSADKNTVAIETDGAAEYEAEPNEGAEIETEDYTEYASETETYISKSETYAASDYSENLQSGSQSDSTRNLSAESVDNAGAYESVSEYAALANSNTDVPAAQPEANADTDTTAENSGKSDSDSQHEYDTEAVMDVSKGAVSFKADFKEKGDTMESLYTYDPGENDTLAVYSSEGGITVTESDTGRVVYSGGDSGEQTARISVESGKSYRVGVTSQSDGESSSEVYVYGYSDE